MSHYRHSVLSEPYIKLYYPLINDLLENKNPHQFENGLNNNNSFEWKEKIEIVDNIIEIPRNIDLLYGLEITGKLGHNQELSQLFKSITFVIDNKIITTYLINQKNNCFVDIDNNNFFRIRINFKDTF